MLLAMLGSVIFLLMRQTVSDPCGLSLTRCSPINSNTLDFKAEGLLASIQSSTPIKCFRPGFNFFSQISAVLGVSDANCLAVNFLNASKMASKPFAIEGLFALNVSSNFSLALG